LLPLINRNRPLGILKLARREDKPFSQDEVEFLTQLANQVAIAVENATAYRQIADLKDKLAQEKLYLEDEIRSELNFEQIVGNSAALHRALRQPRRAAPNTGKLAGPALPRRDGRWQVAEKGPTMSSRSRMRERDLLFLCFQ